MQEEQVELTGPDLGNVGPGLVPAEELDRLPGLGEALHRVGHYQGDLGGGLRAGKAVGAINIQSK